MATVHELGSAFEVYTTAVVEATYPDAVASRVVTHWIRGSACNGVLEIDRP